MEVVCIKEFGDCKVGDVREIPEDGIYSELYFAKTDYDKDHVPASLSEPRDDKEAALAGMPEGPVVDTRSDTPDETEEKALAEAKKAPARKPRSKTTKKDADGSEEEANAKPAADNNDEKSEG